MNTQKKYNPGIDGYLYWKSERQLHEAILT